MASAVLRTLAAAALPAVALTVSWGRLEDTRSREVVLAGLLGLLLALARSWLSRAFAGALALAATTWIAFGFEPWELLPYRDEHVAGPLLAAFGVGVSDFYDVVVPFDPSQRPEMHGVVVLAVFAFVTAVAVLVATRRPLAAAAVTIAGAGWPATLVDESAVAVGTLALAGALSIGLVLRARSSQTLVGGVAIAALVVVGAAWVSSVTSFTREAVVDWQAWDLRGAEPRALGVRFIWDAQYDGISFPPTSTEVLRISGPDRAEYWRASTLDTFFADRWFEDLTVADMREASGELELDSLTPPAAAKRDGWLEQRITVKALVDDRLVAAGTPVALEAPSLGRVFSYAGGIMRAQRRLAGGTRYRVWSYLPDPSPEALAAAPARYPTSARRYLNLWGRVLPPFGTPGRVQYVNAFLDDPSYSDFGAYRPLFEQARQRTVGAKSAYATVLALESWLRQRGGFRYDERPPLGVEPPLVHFVTSSRAGYCQYFAGAMAVMARFLGIPARVAVGFTSGVYEDGAWTVTDHNAHAWVEVWFAGYGWVPFDPTPGRGTFSTQYSLATNSSETVSALRRGDFDALSDSRTGDQADAAGNVEATTQRGERPSVLALGLLLAAVAGAVIGGAKWSIRRCRYLTRSPRRLSTASRRELEGFLRDQGVSLPASATLDDLCRAVDAELGLNGHAFVDAVGRGRFGTPDEASAAAVRARSELRALLKRARTELSLVARLRGFVSLRSLRGWQG